MRDVGNGELLDKTLDAGGDTLVHRSRITQGGGEVHMQQNATGGRLFGAQPTKPLDLQATDGAEANATVHAPPCTRVNLQSPLPPDSSATGSPVAVAQSIAVAVVLNLDGLAGATSTPRLSIVSPPPEGVNPPGFIPSDRVASFPGSGKSRNERSLPEHDSDRLVARQLFR